MATKKKIDIIVAAYRIINAARLTKMEDGEKFSLIKAARQLKKAATDFEELLKDAQARLKPEGIDAIAAKSQAREALAPEESALLSKYSRDVAACVQDELEKEAELDFEPLPQEALGRFVASNDFTLSEILAISDAIGS